MEREPSSSEANEGDEAGDEDDEEGVLEYHFSDSVEDSEKQSLGINDNDEADHDIGDIPFLDREGQLPSQNGSSVKKNYSLQ